MLNFQKITQQPRRIRKTPDMGGKPQHRLFGQRREFLTYTANLIIRFSASAPSPFKCTAGAAAQFAAHVPSSGHKFVNIKTMLRITY